MSRFGNSRIGGFFPPVIKGLLIANVAVFLLQHFFVGTLTFGGVSLERVFIHYFALWQINFDNLIPFASDYQFYPWQLITYQFMHADFWHIFMNMFALWMFGSELESNWGGKRFLSYYLLTGIGAAIIHMLITPIFGEVRPTVGASGAVYGLLLAFGMTYPDRKIFMFPLFIPVPAKYFVMIFAGIELLNGVSGVSGVAHFAHLGGALTGFILLKFGRQVGFEKLVRSISGGQYYDNNYSAGNDYGSSYGSSTFARPKATIYKAKWTTVKEQEPPVTYKSETSVKKYIIDGEEITQVKIDIILDKISASGYQNLTEREKFILTELSKKL
ncbi:MAG: rhomboid family intramembrane serine protease [Candidatus Kapaibacterium sp.]